jgi:ArsR family transcriptional regulator
MLDLPLYEVKADLFRGLAHPLRVRLLEILSGADEVPVAVLLTETGLKPSNLSQHLAVLRRYGLVTSERRGSQVYCSVADPSVGEMLAAARSLLTRTLEARIRVASDLGSSSTGATS